MSRRTDIIDHLQELAASEKAAWTKEKAMPDDPKKTGQDRKLISLEQEYEVRDWCESLGCSREQLHQAVKAVGNSADAVRQYLKTGK